MSFNHHCGRHCYKWLLAAFPRRISIKSDAGFPYCTKEPSDDVYGCRRSLRRRARVCDNSRSCKITERKTGRTTLLRVTQIVFFFYRGQCRRASCRGLQLTTLCKWMNWVWPDGSALLYAAQTYRRERWDDACLSCVLHIPDNDNNFTGWADTRAQSALFSRFT